mgnify:FL=1
MHVTQIHCNLCGSMLQQLIRNGGRNELLDGVAIQIDYRSGSRHIKFRNENTAAADSHICNECLESIRDSLTTHVRTETQDAES